LPIGGWSVPCASSARTASAATSKNVLGAPMVPQYTARKAGATGVRRVMSRQSLVNRVERRTGLLKGPADGCCICWAGPVRRATGRARWDYGITRRRRVRRLPRRLRRNPAGGISVRPEGNQRELDARLSDAAIIYAAALVFQRARGSTGGRDRFRGAGAEETAASHLILSGVICLRCT
jgi:hypothetical protein